MDSATSSTNSQRVSNSNRAASKTTVSVSQPWTQIVRGGGNPESEEISAVHSSSASSSTPVVKEKAPSTSPPSEEEGSVVTVEGSDNDNNNNVSKKPAWNKPSNGAAAVEASVEAAPPVIGGAASWPALSEATKFPQKSSSPDFVKHSVSDGSSVSVSQGSGTTSSSQKQVNNNTNSNLNQNHTYPRQKSMKRHGGNVSSANGGLSQPPPPTGSVAETPSNHNSSNTHKNSSWESGQKGGSGSSSHNDHPQPRNPYRRGSGPHPRGDASYNHGHGGRRDADRVNRDWLSQQRSFNGRDARLQTPGVGSRPFIRAPPSPSPPPPPHGSAPFILPPQMRPFVPPGYPEFPMYPYFYPIAPPDSVRPMPLVVPPPMFVPMPDHPLHLKLVNQIDYYFSNDNLIKDTFLRANMDDQGWVPIILIAGFRKVKLLTEDIQLILNAVRNSSVVEIQGDKVRKRNDWMRWVMPHSAQLPSSSGGQALGRSSNDVLTAHLQNVTLENSEGHNGMSFQSEVHSEAFLRRSSSGESSSQSQPSSLDVATQITVQPGSDASISARNSSNIDSC